MDSTDALTREIAPFLANIAQMLDEMRVEREQHKTLEWTDWNQEQRCLLSNYLRRANALNNGTVEASAQP